MNFGQWAPDSAGVDVPVLTEAKNVFPYEAGYGPIPALGAIGTGPLPTKCLGATYAKTSSGAWVAFAGTATKLYRYIDGVWTDYSRLSGGNYNASDFDKWSFTQFGAQVIAVNALDDPQVINVDAGAVNFSALGGSPPRARYVTTVGDFVVLAGLASDTRAVRNSAINDATGWTVGTSLCDEQSFPDGGRVTGAAGGEFGYIAQERGLRRMIFQPGSDYAFRYEHIEKEIGCAVGYGLIGIGGAIYFPSDDGYYKYGAEGLVPLGAERINTWFQNNSDTARFFEVLGATDPFGPRVYWAFYNTDSDTNYTRLLIYNWKSNRWSYAVVEAQYWLNFATAGITLEGLDALYPALEDVPFSLDSRVWEGGRPGLAALNEDGYLAFLDGTASLDALLRTGPMHVNQGARSKNFDLEPLGVFNDATLAVRVGKQEHTKQAITYTSSITPSTLTGMARCRASGRLHTFELGITQSSGTRWTLAQGFDVQATMDGKK